MGTHEHNPPTYGQILTPESYNSIIGKHVYIPNADAAIRDLIGRFAALHHEPYRVLDLACGPARMMVDIARLANVQLTGIDHDSIFVEFGRKLLAEAGLEHVPILEQDFLKYTPDVPFSLVYTNGVHHHIAKGEAVLAYLRRVYDLLEEGGYYILSDEILPPYATEEERLLRAIIWYSHVIAIAIAGRHDILAIEEAKTLLDDLAQGREFVGYKTPVQTRLIIEQARIIHTTTQEKEWRQVNALATSLLEKIEASRGQSPSGDETIDLSRGDFKIDQGRLLDEVLPVGFRLVASSTFGDTLNIGGMGVYVFQRI